MLEGPGLGSIPTKGGEGGISMTVSSPNLGKGILSTFNFALLRATEEGSEIGTLLENRTLILTRKVMSRPATSTL